MATPLATRSVRSVWRSFLDDLPDFHARLFVAAALTGFVVSLFGVLADSFNDGGPTQIMLSFGLAVFSLAMIWFANVTGRYEQARVVSVVVVFLVVFPYMFFTGGGYQSGMPALLVFGMGFTGLSVVGTGMWVLLGLEFLTYAGCCLTAYYVPGLVTPLAGPATYVVDVIVCLAIAGFALSAILHLLLRVHEDNARLLAARNAELQQIDRGKSEFLAMVAHELNTPLAVMRVHLDEAAAGASGSEAMRHSVGVMTAENERLSRLVEQLRDVSRISSGLMELHVQVEDLSAILQEVLRTYHSLVARNGNVLGLVRGGAHPLVLVDRERVTQVLVNLLSNAALHTTNGTITVAVRERGEFAELTISDTGEGIPLEVQRHLFDRIGRPSHTGIRSSRDVGLGLGLIISRHIMNAHRGEILIESTPGAGTTATLTFRLANFGSVG
ncbi:MAG: sensor histidine kinase [Propionicimonas sp.]